MAEPVTFGLIASMRAAMTTVAWKTEQKCPLRDARVRSGKFRPRPRSCRRGAVLSIELLFAAPILLVLVFAIVEFGLLWSANHRVKAASQVACRIATLPASDPEELRQEMLAATSRVLQHPVFVQQHRISLESGAHAGDAVIVEVRLPMSATAPDLLRIFGFKLKGRDLVARTVMRKE